MDVAKIKEKIPVDLIERLKVVSGTTEEEQQRQDYLQGICQRLMSDDIDFERYPVYFCIVDDENPNAAFVPGKKPKILDEKDLETFGDYRTEKEKAEDEREQYPTIFVTKGLLEMVENEDQLAFILGHELGHHRQEFLLDEHSNSKMEEITSDLNALEMLVKAGYNINEARKLASHIFGNEAKLSFLSHKLARALDAHPNNESRLNAIDIKIKSIEDDYQKQNVDINAIEPTPVSVNIKDDVRENRFVSYFEKELRELGYYDSPLEERQEILLSYMSDLIVKPQYWDRGTALSDQLKEEQNLANIVYGHIKELRKAMPLQVVKQSDADYFLDHAGSKEQEALEKWIEGVGKEYCCITYAGLHLPSSKEMKEILSSYPIKIVPDKEYEVQAAIEAEKKERQRRNLDEGTELAVKFWDRLMRSGIYAYRKYGVVAINNLEGIDLTKTETGRLAIEAINNAMDGKFYMSDYVNGLGAYYQNFNDERHLWSEDESENVSLRHFEYMGYNRALSHFFYRFKPETIPSLNLGDGKNATVDKLPKSILFDGAMNLSLFGIQVNPIIQDEVYVVAYNPRYQDPYQYNSWNNDWNFFVDREGNILDSFPEREFKAKEQELIEKRRMEFYKQIADVIKRDYATLQEIKQNPETDLSAYDLRELKRYTAGQNHTVSSISEHDWRYKVYMATLAVDDPYLQYSTEDLYSILSDDYYTLQKKSPLSKNYLNFDKEAILSFLTEEEKAFASQKYNSENDEAVFNALYHKMIQTKNFGIYLREYNPSQFETYDVQNWGANVDGKLSHLLTNGQVIRYQKKYLEIISAEELQKSYSNEVFGMVQAEMKHLYAYIYHTMNQNPDMTFKDLDFTQHQPLFTDVLSQKIGIPLDLSNYTKIKDITAHQSAFLSYALTNYILRGETDKLPLKEFFNERPTTIFLTNVVKEKFEPFLLNRENYPEDIVDALKTYEKIPQSVREFSVVAPFMVDLIRAEKDPKKSLEASKIFLNTFKYENTDETAALKNSLLENSVIFDKNLPLLQRIGAYQQIAAVSGFADDYKLQNELLKGFMQEIEAIKDPVERNGLYDIFINKEHRISDPDIRREYQRMWVESAFEACGSKIDDNSAELHKKIGVFLHKLHGSYEQVNYGTKKTIENVNMSDKIEISRMLADRFVSQQKLSMMIKPKPASFEEMNQGNKNDNNLMIVGFDFIKLVMQDDRDEASQLIDFLLSKGEISTCAEYSDHLNKKKEMSVFDNGDKTISPETLQVMHREFWGYPLEARAVLINELLYSASEQSSENRWEDIFKKVAPKIFPNADSSMSQIGTEFLHSYIKSRKDNERTLYLAAMMVAANENADTTDPEKSIAKGIRLFLENSGPAAIKLGQAMASYTDVPKFIRDEMQELKSNASRPSRWELYEWLDFYKKDGDEKLDIGENVWLGRILGSASYFVTLEKGQFEDGKVPFQTDRVTKVLRAGAQISSDKEFKIFEKMLDDLNEKGVMKNGVDTFKRLIAQAKDTVEIETDLGIGYEQLQTAKDLYKEKEIAVDGHTFKIHVADWPEYGKCWADLERAKGVDLDKIKDPAYKKAVSKAYFSLELMNMISGGKFDHDRHGKQMKIDTQNNVIGVFDTGAMAIVEPDPKDKEILGKIIYKTLEKALADKDGGFSKVGAILSEEIDKVYTSGETTSPYLTECQRGLLALTDFYRDFSPQDYIDCFNAALNNKEMPLDKHIMNGFVGEAIKSVGVFESEHALLSYEDKEKLGALLFNISATKFMHGDKKVSEVIGEEISKMQQGMEQPLPILEVISSKVKEGKQSPMGLDIPKEFIPTLGDFIARQNVDVAILKGMAREMLDTVDLQKNQDRFSAQDRQEFGRLMYDTFDKSRKEKDKDFATVFLELQKTGNYNSEYAAKMAMIITVASKVQLKDSGQNFNSEELIKSVLLSGKMDKEIVKGITDAIKAKNPDSVTRTLAANAVGSFLTQKRAEPTVFKKALVRMFVKKKDALNEAKQSVNEAIEKPETRKKLVDYIKGYVDKIARLSSIKEKQNTSEPKIRITTPTRTM